eukprot:IDg15984t1
MLSSAQFFPYKWAESSSIPIKFLFEAYIRNFKTIRKKY